MGMIWFDTYKFVFFSYPKTGSESVRRAWRRYSERDIGKVTRLQRPELFAHKPPRDVTLPRGYRAITFVRHPYDRLRSLYAMICQNDRLWRRFGPPPFHDWVAALDPNDPRANGPAHQAWRQYGGCGAHYWLHTPRGQPKVRAYRLEDMPARWPELCEGLGLPLSNFPHRNIGKTAPPTLDERSAKVIRDAYAYEFERFGYDP